MNKIARNPGLFILSFVLAAALWLVINNANDPVRKFDADDIPVTLTHKEVLTGANKVYQVLDGTDKVDVTVRAPRSVIDSLNKENVIATADLNNLNEDGTVPISLTTDRYYTELDSITGNISEVRLFVEDRKSKVIRLRCTTSGEVAEGFLVGDVTPEQNQVRLSGGESVIDRVSYAVADVNVTGFTADITTLADIKLYDESDQPVDTANITMNITSVRVGVEILAVKDVPVRGSYTGTPADGYAVYSEVRCDPGTVRVCGKNSVISGLSVVDIPGTVLDVTGSTEPVSVRVNIEDHLPAGVELAYDIEEEAADQVTLTVDVGLAEIRNIELRYSDVVITGVPAGYSASISLPEDDEGRGVETFIVKAIGASDDVTLVNAGSVTAVADLEPVLALQGGPEKGSFTGVPVTLTLSPEIQDVILDGKVSVTIGLTKEEQNGG